LYLGYETQDGVLPEFLGCSRKGSLCRGGTIHPGQLLNLPGHTYHESKTSVDSFYLPMSNKASSDLYEYSSVALHWVLRSFASEFTQNLFPDLETFAK
jgi:hypothetical protein